MVRSISVKQKKPGRPATGVDPLIGQLDRLARQDEVSRSEAIRRLIDLGLKAAKAEKPKRAK
jgi:metal-responsive CopG/Arc/MetJ family transcriptional regulator